VKKGKKKREEPLIKRVKIGRSKDKENAFREHLSDPVEGTRKRKGNLRG